MNVFILDGSMEKSAQMLDDAHLKAQINEACQILMANYNSCAFPDAKVGHANHPVTKFYEKNELANELVNYCYALTDEYWFRFGKRHQNEFFLDGYSLYMGEVLYECNSFHKSKTLVNGSMTNNIKTIRHYIMTNPHTRPLTWTNRERPDWWEV